MARKAELHVPGGPRASMEELERPRAVVPKPYSLKQSGGTISAVLSAPL
jgi:hypothetical protein